MQPIPLERESGARRDRVVDEAAGVVTLLISSLLLLALVSFDPGQANLIGPVGHFFADSILFLFGLASFCFVAVTGAWGIGLLRGRRLFTRYRETLGYLLVLAIAPTVLHMSVPTPALGHPPGGMLGGLTGGILLAAIGPFGGFLCCSATLLIAALLITDSSLAEILSKVSARVQARPSLRSTAKALDDAVLAEAASPDVIEASADVEIDAAPRIGRLSRLRSRIARMVAGGDKAMGILDMHDVDAELLDAGVDCVDEDSMPASAPRVRRAVVRTTTAPLPAEGGSLGVDDPAADGPETAGRGPNDDPAWLMELSGENLSLSDVSMVVPDEPTAASSKAPPPAPKGSAKKGAANHVAVTGKASTSSAGEIRSDDQDTDHDSAGLGPVIVQSSAQKNRKRAEDLDRAQQVRLPLEEGRTPWEFPPLSFLNYEESSRNTVDKEMLRDLAAKLERVLADFKVKGRVSGICPGPVVTLFEFEPESGTKLSRISGLSDDIAMALRAHKVRIIAPIPGKGCVGIEVPNDSRENVYLKEIIADDAFGNAKSRLTMALGKDIEGFPVVMDLAKSPHLLIAGTTGSGKSVSVNAMITSVLYNASPDDVKMILIDPKQLEFAIYENVPHLLLPVVTDPSKAATALNWAVQDMERRYQLMAELKVRNIAGYNEKLAKLRAKLATVDIHADDYVPSPTEAMLMRTDLDGRFSHRSMFYLVVVVDEFADLMMVAGKEVEIAVARLAQKARAAGIHCILATQRPSVDVITGLIKANFPTRISFRLMSGTDSRTVLDTIGAENLLGMGDMLYRPPGTSELRRIHGAYVDESEIEEVVEFLATQRPPEFDESILDATQPDSEDSDEPVDELYDQAVSVVIEAGFASISMVQRKLRIGYNRSARIVEEMERSGVIGPATGGSSRRDVLVGGAHLSAPM